MVSTSTPEIVHEHPFTTIRVVDPCPHPYPTGRKIRIVQPDAPPPARFVPIRPDDGVWITWCPVCHRGWDDAGRTGLVVDPGSYMTLDGIDLERSLAVQREQVGEAMKTLGY